MSPLKHSTNVAARMGRLEREAPQDRNLRVARVRGRRFSVGIFSADETIDENDFNVGEARRADHIIRDGGFEPDEQGEFVLVQSKTQTATDAEFRAVVDPGRCGTRSVPAGDEAPLTARRGQRGSDLRRRPLGADRVQPEGHVRRGRRLHRHHHGGDRRGAGGASRLLRRTRPARRRRGRRSTSSSSRSSREPGSSRSRSRSESCCSSSARSSARRSRFSSASRRCSRRWAWSLCPSQFVPMDELDRRGHPADRARGRRRLLALLHPPRARRAARRPERVGRPRGRRSDLGSCRAHLRHHGDDRDGRHVLLRRQDVHVVRDRHDDGRRRRDDRLADRAAGDALVARRPGRQGSRAAASAAQRPDGEGLASGAAILDRVLRHPVISAIARDSGSDRAGAARPAPPHGDRPGSMRCRSRRRSCSRIHRVDGRVPRAARLPRSSPSPAMRPIPSCRRRSPSSSKQALASGEALEPI